MINSAEYRETCYEPLLRNGEKVQLSFVIGIPQKEETYQEVWKYSNYTLGTDLVTEFFVPIDSSVRLNGALLKGYLIINTSPLAFGYSERVVVTVDLTLSREIRTNFERKNLLMDLSDSKPQQNKINDSSLKSKVQHWKYAIEPLQIRTINLNDVVLESNFLPQLLHEVPARQVAEQLYYEPIVFIDEFCIQSRSYLPMSRNTSTPNPKLKLKITPTSTLMFAFKKLLVEIMKILGPIVGESELEEMKFWFSDDYLFRYLLSQLIVWIHIIFEFLAFRQDWFVFHNYLTGFKDHSWCCHSRFHIQADVFSVIFILTSSPPIPSTTF